jgi:hypothetical protein
LDRVPDSLGTVAPLSVPPRAGAPSSSHGGGTSRLGDSDCVLLGGSRR